MEINFSAISNIFLDFLRYPAKDFSFDDKLSQLIFLIIKTNKILWDLEDSSRLPELGDRHVAEAKKKIDICNQKRNDLIREIDVEVSKYLNVSPGLPEEFYSESFGVIIDKLSIMFIKQSIIRSLLTVIKEEDLRSEYEKKEKIIIRQIKNTGRFIDLYIKRLIDKKVFFEIQEPVKIYNDNRIKNYLKLIDEGKT